MYPEVKALLDAVNRAVDAAVNVSDTDLREAVKDLEQKAFIQGAASDDDHALVSGWLSAQIGAIRAFKIHGGLIAEAKAKIQNQYKK